MTCKQKVNHYGVLVGTPYGVRISNDLNKKDRGESGDRVREMMSLIYNESSF